MTDNRKFTEDSRKEFEGLLEIIKVIDKADEMYYQLESSTEAATDECESNKKLRTSILNAFLHIEHNLQALAANINCDAHWRGKE